MGDRVVILDKGKIQQADTPLEVYNNPNNKFVAGFIGSPQMNFIDCDIINNTLIMGKEPVIELSKSIIEKLGNRKNVVIGIRPENMIVMSGRIKLSVVIEMTELLGSEQIIYFNIGQNMCCARISSTNKYENNIQLNLDSDKFLYFDSKTGERLI